MELDTVLTWLSNFLLAVGGSLLLWRILQRDCRKRQLPPGLPSWPVVGSLPYLQPDLHNYFRSLSKKYGPIFSLHLGAHRVVVISSVELAEELFKTKDLQFAHRPGSTLFKTMSEAMVGGNIVFANFSPRLKFIRKVFTTKVVSTVRTKSVSNLRADCQVRMIEAVETVASSGRDVALRDVLTTMTATIINQMCFGLRYNSTDWQSSGVLEELKQVMDEYLRILGKLNLADLIPVLRWLNPLIYEPEVRKFNVKRRKVFAKILEDRRIARKTAQNTEQLQDFVDDLLVFEGDDELSDDAITGALTDIITGGTDTTATTLEWIMIELLRNPEIMENLRREIDGVVGFGRCVDESDIPNLPYLQAVVKEAFRFHPVVPLLVPRVNVEEDSSLGGYDIPKGTILYVNIWAIGRDPSIWEKPEEFRPERFLKSKVNVFGTDYQLLPFGSGRRGCPGLQMALVIIHHFLAALVHAFDWYAPQGVMLSDISNQEQVGVVLHPLHPLVATAKPRTTLQFYKHLP